MEKLKRQGIHTDYVAVCSPNYLHDAHIRFGLRIGADVICEKPVVLNPWNIDALMEIEKETGRHVYTILQLRLHPAIIELREKIKNGPADKIYDIKLRYITSRGHWYHTSWKGNIEKSGGIATNIGVHFFDMLLWLFGPLKESSVTQSDSKTATGTLQLERATVNWTLSIDKDLLPEGWIGSGKKTWRRLLINNEEFDFSDGFEHLHTAAYREILGGNIITLEEMKPVTTLLSQIRRQSSI